MPQVTQILFLEAKQSHLSILAAHTVFRDNAFGSFVSVTPPESQGL